MPNDISWFMSSFLFILLTYLQVYPTELRVLFYAYHLSQWALGHFCGIKCHLLFVDLKSIFPRDVYSLSSKLKPLIFLWILLFWYVSEISNFLKPSLSTWHLTLSDLYDSQCFFVLMRDTIINTVSPLPTSFPPTPNHPESLFRPMSKIFFRLVLFICFHSI